MQKIVPHLWYDHEAREAAERYVALFPDSRLLSVDTIGGTPSGDTEIVGFVLAGLEFMAISAGPWFRFNPSISLMVHCGTAEEVDRLWDALSEGGEVLMALEEYPFSRRYGWCADRYGLSWQLMLTEQATAQKIVPCLMFSDGVCGKAEEAVRFYAGLFPGAAVDMISGYAPGEAMDERARVNYAAFTLDGLRLAAMDHAMGGEFTFNEAISLLVRCESAQEEEALWNALTAVPESEQCGWLKDRFGLSWQIVPDGFEELMTSCTPEESERVMAAFFEMGRIDVAALSRAKEGKC